MKENMDKSHSVGKRVKLKKDHIREKSDIRPKSHIRRKSKNHNQEKSHIRKKVTLGKTGTGKQEKSHI